MRKDLTSLEATEQFANEVAKVLRPGESVGLSGELGAGKTTFVRFLSKALESSTPVSSPTFVLAHEYQAAGGIKIEHWDLYRLGAVPEELEQAPDNQTIRLVEWADKIESYFGTLRLWIRFSQKSADARSVELSPDLKSRLPGLE